jgi:two-component system sensor histidine kinase UhpB
MRLSSLPLFWRVFYTNAAVLVLAFLALVFAPVTVSVPLHLTELIVLAIGLAGMLAITLALLRPAFRPLDELAETMRRHDPLSPGLRARVKRAGRSHVGANLQRHARAVRVRAA